METNLNKAVEAFASVTGCRFASITYKAKESGEVARHLVLLGVDYMAAVRADISKLNKRQSKLSGIMQTACLELLASLRETREVGVGNNSRYTQADTWETVDGLPGVRFHKVNGSCQVFGMRVSKTVLVPGEYKPDTRRELTKAKDAIRKTLKTSRFRPYCVTAENLKSVAVNGNRLEIATA